MEKRQKLLARISKFNQTAHFSTFDLNVNSSSIQSDDLSFCLEEVRDDMEGRWWVICADTRV